MFRICLVALLFAAVIVPALTEAAEIETRSPDGRIGLIVSSGAEGLAYRVTVDGEPVIAPTLISITIDGTPYPGPGAAEVAARETIDRRIVPTVPTITAEIRESCNETLVRCAGPVALRVRAYNDGVALRWESRLDRDEVTVNGETFALAFATDPEVHFPVPNGQGFFSHQENQFHRQPVSATVNESKPGPAPVLFDLGGERCLLLTDVNVEGYPGLWVEGAGGTAIRAQFPPYPARTEMRGDRDHIVAEAADFLARTAGTRTYPWRAMVIASPQALLTSTLLYTLAEPNRIGDTSWIKPGKVAWDWYNHWNITDVPFQAGINQDTYKNYIDFASTNGLPYIILDEGWSVPGPENLLQVIPALDIPGLVAYATERDVGVILWMTSAALEHTFDRAFAQFTTWGVKGLKVDFMQRDDQVMMDFCARVAREAARRRLLVDFHGGSKPVGMQRTYPNVLTQESVLGLENSKWSKLANPEMAVLLPFIRMMAGPMDYTPGAMDNFTDTGFRQEFENPGSLGTRCHQLGMYVVFLSPLQMLADTPTKYRANPECLAFLREVPTTWDQTVVLRAEIGEVIAVARRHGDRWFIGALTDWTPREFTAPLDFLGEGEYTLAAWADGPEAAVNATDYRTAIATVSAGMPLTLRLAPGGGYAAILTPRRQAAAGPDA